MRLLNTLKSKLFNFLNIDIQKNQKWLLMSSLASGLIYSFSCAPIQKEIVSQLPAEYISFEALWFCLSALLIGMIWKGQPREVAVKHFTILALSESILACTIAFYLVFIHYNIWLFAISTLLYSSIVTTFIGKCIMMFESRLWKAEAREKFDNTSSVVRNITACVGFGIATLSMPKLETAILLWGIGCIFDDIGWIIVYNKSRSEIISAK